jgi:hypothetical protein
MWDAPLLALFQKWEYDSLQRKFFEVEVLSITLKQFFRHDDSASFSLKIALCPIQIRYYGSGHLHFSLWLSAM